MRLILSLQLAIVLLPLSLPGAQAGAEVSGTVRDSKGGAIQEAEASLLTAHRAVFKTARTDARGEFRFSGIPAGTYELLISSKGFAAQRVALEVRRSEAKHIEAVLELESLRSEVTVTAVPGRVEDARAAAQAVNVIEAEEIRERAKAVVAQVATEEAGVHLQRTSPSIAGIYVRGLTGNKVSVFIDGVRYSTSAARGGINTFLDLIEPSDLEAVEILRGPNSAEYGSDAIGGSIQFLSRVPELASTAEPVLRGASDNFCQFCGCEFRLPPDGILCDPKVWCDGGPEGAPSERPSHRRRAGLSLCRDPVSGAHVKDVDSGPLARDRVHSVRRNDQTELAPLSERARTTRLCPQACRSHSSSRRAALTMRPRRAIERIASRRTSLSSLTRSGAPSGSRRSFFHRAPSDGK